MILTSNYFLTYLYKFVFARLQTVLNGSVFIPNADHFGHVYTVFIYTIIFMFSYLAAQSTRQTRNFPEASAFILSVIIYDAVYFLTTGLFLGNLVPDISNTYVSLIGDKLSGLNLVYCVLITPVILVCLFFAGCSLYEKHFERSI